MKAEKSRSQKGQKQVMAEKVKKAENQKTVQDMKSQVGPMKSLGIKAKKRIIQGIGNERERNIIVGYIRGGKENLFQVFKIETLYLGILQDIERVIPVVEVIA
jgi:hypothetical protein